MSDAAVVAASSEAIRKGSQSFAAAARLFDPETRDDCVMLYAWCRHCDDVIDGQSLGHDARDDYRDGQDERLALLRAQTHAAANGQPADDPVFKALAAVVKRKRIPTQHLDELLDGFAMDVAERQYATAGDTLDYAYHVAGVVGVMMAMIMDVRDPRILDRASDLGLGFQLTNIARDVVDDARAGRVYVPAEWLAEEGLVEVNADDQSQWPALYRVALRLLDTAEPYYESARIGMAHLPWRSAWAIAAARRVYRAIGTRLRARGAEAWHQRVSTSKAEKLMLVGLALGDVIASRFSKSDPPRTGLYDRPGRG
ncbi:phytoene/squalene synthase family protein [Devosia sp.]|uniref:phytoene/squalene synthase family protein n=1 Tax=Devosia sp. TaxID=1871048 RepID=UPI003A94C720